MDRWEGAVEGKMKWRDGRVEGERKAPGEKLGRMEVEEVGLKTLSCW